MKCMTSFQVLLIFQMLYQGASQGTFIGTDTEQSYECYVHVEWYTDVSCMMDIPHHGCEDFLYNIWVPIIDWEAALLIDSGTKAFFIDDVQTEMFKQPPDVLVCRYDKAAMRDVINRRMMEYPSVLQHGSPCHVSHPCLAYLPKVPVPVNVKSLKIVEVGEIKLQKTSFQSFPNLTVLSLTKSHAYLDHDAFYGLSSLRTLTLSGDNITVLPPELFLGLEQLTELDLSGNRLQEISREHLAPLHSLVSLDISHNQIRALGDDVFFTLPALKLLSASSNQLKTLPAAIFRTTNYLTNIDLSGNRITELPKGLFWGLRRLGVLDLSRCALHALDNSTFANSSNLKVLMLNNNELSFLPDNIFPVQFKLEVLDVSHNKLHFWSVQILRNVLNLKTLLLNGNELGFLPTDMLNATRDLKIFDVTENKLRSFSGNLLKSLRYLDVLNASGNQIRHVELGLYNPVSARKLNFSRNEITRLDIRWEEFAYLENADFDWNGLTSIDLPACAKEPRTQIVFSFRNNNISHVKMKLLRGASNCSGHPENSVFLAGNALNCDCKLYAFYKNVTKQGSVIPYKFPDSDTWKCNKPKFLKDDTFISLNENMFHCPVNNCPESCFCGVRATDNRTIVNCTGKNLSAVPDSVPDNVYVLYFGENKLRSLNLRKSLWQNLTELHLENNLLENLEASDIPEGVRVLSLSGNRLRNMSLSLRNFVSLHDVRLRLGNNNWNCTCSLKNLKDWLVRHKRNIDDLNDVTCEIMENGEDRSMLLYKIPGKLLCPEELSQNLQIATVAVVVSSSVLFIAVLLILYYKNTETVQAFLYGSSLFQCFFREDPEQEEEKIFDAFVAYSGKDREVVMKLLEELEGESPFFKLCIHERDWIPGRFISENIILSVQNSRRMILILSEDFVNSAWFAVEVRAVLLQMLQDHINRLLVIVVGAFPSLDAIESDIRQLVLRRTYLVWGERWFWEKIRYALPHKGKRRTPHTETHGRKFRLVSLIEQEVSEALNQQTLSEDNV